MNGVDAPFAGKRLNHLVEAVGRAFDDMDFDVVGQPRQQCLVVIDTGIDEGHLSPRATDRRRGYGGLRRLFSRWFGRFGIGRDLRGDCVGDSGAVEHQARFERSNQWGF